MALTAVALLCAWPAAARAELVTVTVTNLQPANGAWITPVFLATHSGNFDPFNLGQPASQAVERLAEDGLPGPLVAQALASGQVAQALVAGAPPGIAPGQSFSVTFDVDPSNPLTRFLSFMSMVIPSNDAFIGNDNPQLLPLFDAGGNLIERAGGTAFVVAGPTGVYDAGTEVNDEVPQNTAFLGQVVDDTGVPQGGVIGLHPGFQGSLRLGGPAGNILTAFPGADFTQPGALVASITVTAIPEPSTLTLAGVAALGGLACGWRRRKRAA